MKVWVVTGESESTDDYGPFVFSRKPSRSMLRKLAFDCDGNENDPSGPGDFGSYTYLTTRQVEVDEMLRVLRERSKYVQGME